MSGFVIWLTGLPGSGKSIIADGIKTYNPDFIILRMDELRKIVTPEPSYSDPERDTVYRAIVYMAKTLSELGHNVIIDATGNRKKWRELARQLVPRFAEIYLKCPIDICKERESRRNDARGAPEGIYNKATAGWPVPGIHTPYEEPLSPELTVETDKTSLENSLSAIQKYISTQNRR